VSRQGDDDFALLLNDITSLVELEKTLERTHYLKERISSQMKYSRSDIEADQTAFADFNLAFDKLGKALAQCLQKN
jgi:hypothetical protein